MFLLLGSKKGSLVWTGLGQAIEKAMGAITSKATQKQSEPQQWNTHPYNPKTIFFSFIGIFIEIQAPGSDFK